MLIQDNVSAQMVCAQPHAKLASCAQLARFADDTPPAPATGSSVFFSATITEPVNAGQA